MTDGILFIMLYSLHILYNFFVADCDTGGGFERGGDVSKTSSLNSNTGINNFDYVLLNGFIFKRKL